MLSPKNLTPLYAINASLEAQNGLHSIILANECKGIILRCALTRGHAGASRGHCDGMTGMASGNVHRMV